MTRRNTGFTLIELSIVLVIIGLIVGGVLVGRDLIKAAEIRKQITQLAELDSAANTFRSKYNGIPGDMPNATSFLPATTDFSASSINGDGDGIIYVSVGSGNTNLYSGIGFSATDPNRFFINLYLAGLVSPNYNKGESAGIAGNCGDVPFPVSPIRGKVGVYTNHRSGTSDFDPLYHSIADDKNYYVVGIGVDYSDCSDVNPYPVHGGTALTPLEALQLDQKLDDGHPMTGIVKATSGDGAWQSVFYDPVPGHAANYYAGACVGNNSEYDVSQTIPICSLRIRTSW